MKNSSEKNEKSSRKDSEAAPAGRASKKTVESKITRRRRGHKDDDDESVDSKGNIRGLIVSTEEEELSDDSSVYEQDTSPSEELAPRSGVVRRLATRAGRRAAIKARERIRNRLAKKEAKEVKEAKSSKKRTSRKEETESEEESEEEDEDEDEDAEGEGDGEDDDEEEDEEYEEDDENSHGGIMINFGTVGDNSERMIPKRHNMKKENEITKRFVKLVTAPMEENTIDDQIDQFQALTEAKQKQMIDALERKSTASAAEQPLMFRILSMNLPVETQSMVLNKYNNLQGLDSSSGEYFKLRAWLEKLTSIPFGLYKEMPVKLDDGQDKCTAFMNRAKACMEEAIYGQDESKMQILQFIASKIANPTARGLSLLLVGPPGIGKTSLIKNGIAKALDWPFQFISLGGDSDATTYTGHQLVYESSHCGKIVNSLCSAKSMSMILMFDELDKISGTPKGEEVQNMLIHLTDPVQNGDFEDKYLAGVPIDLSRSMFVFSGNDINKIDRVLLDRMIVVKLEGYSAKEKQAIAEQYLVPAALKEVNLVEKVGLSSEVIQHIIREYASEETGVRELKRSVEAIVQKINMLRMFNSKDLPFHIKEFSLPFVVKKEHVDLFLKKKDSGNESFRHLYT